MKKAVAYHGSFAEFDAFDASFSNERHQAWGGGFYLASSPETAKLYGDNVYEVEISYSTDLRTAKRHGRETDFHYNPDTGYWVIPHAKAGNLRILRKTRA
ncbi:hypothetical protein [Gordonibacter massiliensis (ex Traore et al. 2017)]|uniref:ADP-ribosyltransferase-containing protein n=1 Tax=Gordonibacter massiliensis (ex Traore et al. 2017) TaxID=1841863 RepID=UPI001C8C0930|nr:hypothetical protein [Gordonibacter massiliensis (ex Traore et al. 2017)]MBX9035043.1 hypothetical protein [Gordonibacter massiliensis (ex Traore et al. 2017)]